MEQARGRSICSTMWITGVPILLESVEFREYRFHTGLRTEELWKSSIRTGAITAACAPVLWQSVSPPSVLSAAGAWHQKASVMTSYHELSPSVAHKSRFKSHMLTWCSASRIEIIKRERERWPSHSLLSKQHESSALQCTPPPPLYHVWQQRDPLGLYNSHWVINTFHFTPSQPHKKRRRNFVWTRLTYLFSTETVACVRDMWNFLRPVHIFIALKAEWQGIACLKSFTCI